MDIRSLPSIIAFTLNVLLGLIVLSNDPKKTPNRLFTLFVFSLAIWNIGEFVTINSYNPALVVLGLRVFLAGLFIAPVFFLQFTCVFPRKCSVFFDTPRNSLITYLVPIVSLSLLLPQLSGLRIESELQKGWNYVFYPTIHPELSLLFHIPYFVLVGLIVFYTAWGIRNLIVSLRTRTLLARQQLQVKYLIFGIISMGIATGAIDLSNYLFHWGLPLFFLSSLYSLLVSLFFALAILKYRPLEIHTLIKGGILYSSLSAVVLVIYILVVKKLSDLIGGVAGTRSLWTEALFVLALVILSRPLKNKVERIIDRFFYRGKYEHQKELMDFGETLTDITDPKELLQTTANFIAQAFRLRQVVVFLLNRETNRFIPCGQQSTGPEIEFGPHSPLPEKLRTSKAPLEFEDLKEALGDHPDMEKLTRTRASIVVPMWVKDELLAFAALGEKISKQSWMMEDLEFLTIFFNQAAVATSRALIYQEVKDKERELMRSEKLAALGELSAGIAHEIRNPLGVISGSAQTLGKTADEPTREELTEFIIEETERLNNLLRDFLDFARPRELNLTTCDLRKLADRSLELVDSKAADCGVKIEKEYSPDLPLIVVDPVQIEQIFVNLELNAIEAMPRGGTLKIGIGKSNSKKFALKISDTGCGISAQIRSRIYDPFFTTKETGTGLGLSVVHRIVENHAGEISLSSIEGEGSTFTVTLPINSNS